MGKRRGLSEALDLSTEKLAFIHQNNAPPTGNESTAVASHTNPQTPNSTVQTAGAPRLSRESQPIDAGPPQPDSTQMARKPHKIGPHNLALVPLTTRLQPETAAALRRAYLERKLAGADHATQQEIVEEAIHRWLRAEGFLGPQT